MRNISDIVLGMFCSKEELELAKEQEALYAFARDCSKSKIENKDDPTKDVKMRLGYLESGDIKYVLVLEHENKDGNVQFFIKEDDNDHENFENAHIISKNDNVYNQIQEYCMIKYEKTIEELAMPSIPALLDKIDYLEKRIEKLEEYAEALDMVAELINDVFPE